MFPSARAQWLSQLSSGRWRSKDNCQVSFSEELVIFGHSCPDKWGYVDDCFHFCCVFTMMCMTDRGSPVRFLSIFKPLGQMWREILQLMILFTAINQQDATILRWLRHGLRILQLTRSVSQEWSRHSVEGWKKMSAKRWMVCERSSLRLHLSRDSKRPSKPNYPFQINVFRSIYMFNNSSLHQRIEFCWPVLLCLEQTGSRQQR